jgi:drug/metabolite transporter (DMT)-like permease
VSFDRRLLIWPFLILVGSTVIDFGIAWLSKEVEDDNQLTLFSSLSFFTAGITGIVLLIVRRIAGVNELGLKEVAAGIGLGLVNFGSIFFLVKAYDSDLLPRSSLLPVNNLSVVLIGAAAAMILFRERLSKVNWIGVALSVAALSLLLLETAW